MRKLLLRTFVSIFVASAMLMTLLLPIAGGLAILFPLLLLVCAPFPTYVAIIIYHFGLLLGIIIVIDKPWHYFIHEYADEFATTNFPAIALAVSIPLADVLIRKIELDLKEYKKKISE